MEGWESTNLGMLQQCVSVEFQQAFGRHSTMIPHLVQQQNFIAPTIRLCPYAIIALEPFNPQACLAQVCD